MRKLRDLSKPVPNKNKRKKVEILVHNGAKLRTLAAVYNFLNRKSVAKPKVVHLVEVVVPRAKGSIKTYQCFFAVQHELVLDLPPGWYAESPFWAYSASDSLFERGHVCIYALPPTENTNLKLTATRLEEVFRAVIL